MARFPAVQCLCSILAGLWIYPNVVSYPTLRFAPLRRIALLLHYPTARASKAHRPTTTLLLPYARRGGPTTTAASARRGYNTVAPYYYPTYYY